MKPFTLKILAAFVAGSVLFAPTAEANKKLLAQYEDNLESAIGDRTGRKAINAANKVFSGALNGKLRSSAVDLVKLATNALKGAIKRDSQLLRAQTFIKTLTGPVLRRLRPTVVNGSLIEASKRVPRGTPSQQLVISTEKVLKAGMIKAGDTVQDFNIAIGLMARNLRQPVPPPISSF